jgi:hypothetical protein
VPVAIAAAASSIGDGVRLAAACRSDRLADHIRSTCAGLDKWAGAVCVRDLDEQLLAYGFITRT